MTVTERKIKKMEGQIKDWGSKIESLIVKAETTAEHVRADCRRNARELRAQWFDAQARLERFKAAGSETWDAFRTGIEGAWMDLETALTEAAREEAPPRPGKKALRPRTAPTRIDFKDTVPRLPTRHRSSNR